MPYYNYLGIAMPEGASPASTMSGTTAGGETLTAPPGPSQVIGNGGGDLLIGNTGDVTFTITDPRDRVEQSAGAPGTKTIVAWTSFSLPANVQNLTVQGDSNYAIGNSLDNLIIISDDQWVDGGPGNDVLVGGSGRATFEIRAGEGSDLIYGWHSGDRVRLVDTSLANFSQIQAAMIQSGSDVVIRIDASETLTIRNTTIGQFSSADFLQPLDPAVLGAMTFDDEFNSLSLYDPSTNSGVWQTNFGVNLKDRRAYALLANGERQLYVTPDFQGTGDHPLGYDPFSVSGGILSITAQPINPVDRPSTFGADYISGMINTLGTFQQKYGYFEMRAQLPSVAGTWPAFWLVVYPWAPYTEADVTEGLGREPTVDFVTAYGGEANSQTITMKPTNPIPRGSMFTGCFGRLRPSPSIWTASRSCRARRHRRGQSRWG